VSLGRPCVGLGCLSISRAGPLTPRPSVSDAKVSLVLAKLPSANETPVQLDDDAFDDDPELIRAQHTTGLVDDGH